MSKRYKIWPRYWQKTCLHLDIFKKSSLQQNGLCKSGRKWRRCNSSDANFPFFFLERLKNCSMAPSTFPIEQNDSPQPHFPDNNLRRSLWIKHISVNRSQRESEPSPYNPLPLLMFNIKYYFINLEIWRVNKRQLHPQFCLFFQSWPKPKYLI